MGYAARAPRIRVAKLGGLPCMRSPIRKILAASHTPNHAVAAPIAIVIHTCQNGGGVFDAMRRSMAKLFTNGVKLITTLKAEFGSRDIGSQRNHWIIKIIVIGAINPWASFMLKQQLGKKK
jgi:hypothetical protein